MEKPCGFVALTGIVLLAGVAAAGVCAGSAGTGGASGGDPCGASNLAALPLPTFPRAFNVTSYGAAVDGKTDNTSVIQAALDAAASTGGGTVTVPSGRFLSGPIVIGSSTNLVLASGAVLKMLLCAAGVADPGCGLAGLEAGPGRREEGDGTAVLATNAIRAPTG